MANEENKNDLYTTVLHFGESRIEEKKSIFIGSCCHVDSVEEANSFVKSIREKYPDARHNVFAYLVGNSNTRYSDDGEPSGTAGMPVLNVITKSGLKDVAIVVTRYFGGTLLGTGGLVRAYTASAKEAIINAEIAKYEPYSIVDISCNYSDYQKLQNEFGKFHTTLVSTDFADDVKLSIGVKSTEYERFSNSIKEITSARATCKFIAERNELIKNDL